jgi:hypothetical protein
MFGLLLTVEKWEENKDCNSVKEEKKLEVIIRERCRKRRELK